MLERKDGKAKGAKFLVEGPKPRVPHLISLPSWAVKTIVPFSRGDQVVILHAFVGFGKTQYQSNNIGLRLEVIPGARKLMALIHMNYIMLCES